MKLLPTIITVSSIACGLTQAFSFGPSSDPFCPPECSLRERELLELVKQGYPDVLNELEDKYTLTPSGFPISEILSAISDHPSSDGNSPEEDQPEGIKVPFVQVDSPAEVVNAINALPDKIPARTINELIKKEPTTLTSAFKTVCKNLGTAFETVDLVDTPLDSKKLVKQLKKLKKKKVDKLDLISTFLDNIMPLDNDKHRLYRTFKFFLEAVRKDSCLKDLFKRLLPSEELPNVASMPFKKLIEEIVKHNPGTEMQHFLSIGDCGCFDFSDSTIEISKVDIPDHTAVADALTSLPEYISSKTISKFVSKRPRTLGDALKILSPHLGNAFKDTGLDLPLDIDRFNADIQNAARQNGGSLPRYIFIAHLLKNIKPIDPVQAFRALKFWRYIVKYNPHTSEIFSRFIPSKQTHKIPAWSSKDLVKKIVKYNPESHIAKSLTGRSRLSHPYKHHHRHGPGGAIGLGVMASKPENQKKIKETLAKSKKTGESRPLVDPIPSNSTTKGAPKNGIPKIGHQLHPKIGTTVIDPKKGQLTGKPEATNTGAKSVIPKSTILTGKPEATKIAPKPIGKIGTTKVAPKSRTEIAKKVDSAGAKPTAALNGAITAASAQEATGTATSAASASGNAVAKGASDTQSSSAKSGGFKTGGIKPAREQSGGSASGSDWSYESYAEVVTEKLL